MAYFKINLRSADAITPQRATEGSAGYDLATPHDLEVAPESSILIDLEQSWEFPPNICAHIRPRSSLASRGLTTDAGIIDSDYRGSVKVLLKNQTKLTWTFKKGERIAQVLLFVIQTPPVSVTEILTDTVRGEGGFGSTNK